MAISLIASKFRFLFLISLDYVLKLSFENNLTMELLSHRIERLSSNLNLFFWKQILLRLIFFFEAETWLFNLFYYATVYLR